MCASTGLDKNAKRESSTINQPAPNSRIAGGTALPLIWGQKICLRLKRAVLEDLYFQ